MKWSVMNVRARVIGFGVICVSVFAVMTMGIASCSDSVENEVSQEKSIAVESEVSQENSMVVESDHPQDEDYWVKLKPKHDDTGIMEVSVDPGKKCEKNWHAGCMRFLKNTVGHITFYLNGSRNVMKSCDQPGVERDNKKIELTATGDTDAAKGVFNNDRRPDWLKYQAFLSLDLVTGVVYEAPTVQAYNKLTLTNNNSTLYEEGEEGEKQFWYKVTVTSCDGLQTWVTDPRGDNEGRN
jgi:hypothetical protein